MTRIRPALRAFILAGALTGALAGCGLTGDLQRPDPLFGDPDDRGAASLPDRDVERGLPDTGAASPEDEDGDETDETGLPDAEDELLGGPGGG